MITTGAGDPVASVVTARCERMVMGSRAPRSSAEVRSHALHLFRALDLDVPLVPRTLCARLGERRGRPIELIEHSFAYSGAFGLWIGTAAVDHVVVERDTTPDHKRHIVLHEIGHIVFDHGGDDDGALWRELTAALPEEMVVGARPRSSYDSASEYEAELFASIVENWAAAMATEGRRRTEGALGETFDDPVGWR